MPLEVEMKFRVLDRAALTERLVALNMQPGKSVTEVDRYFAHPVRKFAQTDEALRIRCVGEENYLTYKGPKLDATTKTRREIELSFAQGAGEADQMGQLLIALGFSPVADVRKRRQYGTLQWQGREVTVSLDDVERVGHFVELEIIAEEGELDVARECVMSLAHELQLTHSERRSYLGMLLESE